MQHLLRSLRARRDREDRGFTLIELLVVVVIIGVLVAIAVPVYLNYRKGANDKASQSDLRGAISSIEGYYTNNSNTYPVTGAPGITAAGVKVSTGTTLTYTLAGTTYTLCSYNADGTRTYAYDSSKGGAPASVSGTNQCAAAIAAIP